MSKLLRSFISTLLLLPFCIAADDGDLSTCFGTTSNGRLENGWKLPARGPNFVAYSTTGRLLGRTYVHSTVYDIVVDAYAGLLTSSPDKTYVYGETGKRNGGPFDPHKTHRNGLSVDFMVPVIDADGHSVSLPTGVLDKWGYDLEFDEDGALGKLQLDVDAMSEHLYWLHVAAKEHGADIWRVIFDPQLQPLLHTTSRWDYLEENVQFSKQRSWVRHDEHYHVDFRVPCQPRSDAYAD